MVNYPPAHCPYCGTELRPQDPPTVYSCTGCDRLVFHNPTPSARVLVLDGDRFLLVKQGVHPVEGKWLSPGGKIEIGESPPEAAARELHEEVNLTVDPKDLMLVDAIAAEAPEEHHIVSIRYTVDYESTEGILDAGDDAADARFWSRSEFRTTHQNGYPDQVDAVLRFVNAAQQTVR